MLSGTFSFGVLDYMSVVGVFVADRSLDWQCASLVWGMMLGGVVAVLQEPTLNGLSLDSLELFDDGLSLPM